MGRVSATQLEWFREDRGKRRIALSVIVLFLLSLMVQYASFASVPSVLAAHDEGIFELDGDALDDTDADFANDADWEDGAEGAADTFFVGAAGEAAANDDTYLQTGNSKDENDVSSWVITDTGAPDKNELLDAYAAVYQVAGETWIYFGADRFDNDGTAQIGFWFFQDDLAIEDGAFTGGHVDGDVLIISEYTNGGVVSTICAYVWDSVSDGDNIDTDVDCDEATNGSNLDLVAAGASCDTADGTYDICAVSNAAETDAPWPFENKDEDSDFGPGQFFEGGLNLSDMMGDNLRCFGTFLAETRTSAETDAQLKDIAFGDFDTCVPPTITTTSSHGTRDFGQQVTDTANLSGANGAVTGSVDFFICTPTQVTAGGCEGSAGSKVGATKTIAAGSATSDAYTIGLTAAAAGKYCWRAEYTPDASSNYKAGSHTNSTTECFTVAPATIAIDKTANPAGPVLAGGEIGFDITVTNTGDGTALGVNVTDNLPAGISWTADAPTGNTDGVSCSINTAPNPDVLTCTDAAMPADATFTVHIHGATDAADCGTVNNTASVTTTNDGSANDGASVLVGCPELAIDKVDNTGTYDSVGDVISYSITVTNTGNVPLSNVLVTDPNAVGLDCLPAAGNQTTIPTLGVGESVVCSASHTVTQADIDAGHYFNQACADDGNGDGTTGADPVCDDVDTPGEQNPSLAIDKVDNTGTYDSVGDVISYSITVTNDGNVTLTNVVVTDPNAAGLDCSADAGLQTVIPSLAPGASVVCSASHTVTQADLDAGHYFNQACADDGNGDGETGADPVCDDVDTPGEQEPALSIDKVDNTGTFDSVGDVISYSITVTNTGNITLTNVVVTDPNAAGLDCSADAGLQTVIPSLAPGASVVCSASHTVTQADLDAGHYFNQACADDGNGDGETGADPVCDDVDTPGEQNPELAIDKVDNTGTYDAVGDVINYSIMVTNAGNVTLTNVVVTDPNASNLDCTPDLPVASLAPGASFTCTANHTVTQADLDAGHYANEACADDGNGDGDTGADEVCDDVDTPGEQNPELDIVKDDGDATYDSVGDVINYTIVATNTGNVTLHDVVITDPNAENLDCTPDLPVASLAPGAQITCTADHTVTQDDIDAGSYLNTACVDDESGAEGEGADEACDDENTPGSQNPELDIVKDDAGATYDEVGDVIHYTIVATNIGNVTLKGVVVTDPQVTDLECTPATPVDLAPGASIECTASHTVTQEDLDNGSYLNTACANDTDGPAAEVCDDEDTPGEQNPHLTIDKVDETGGFDSVGDVIDYTIVATNDGNVTLHGVVVTDPNVTDLECTPAGAVDLAPGESITCTASHTITQEDLDAGHFFNEACVDDTEGPAEEACDDVDTPGDQNPDLDINKEVAEVEYTEVGQVLHYTIVATNVGNVTLHDVVVTDEQVTDLECTPAIPVATLAVGDSITCTASHTVTQEDLDIGFFFNQACADDGMGDGDTGAVEVCDDVTTPGQQAGGETDAPTPPDTTSFGTRGNGSPSDGSWLLVVALGLLLASIVMVTPRRNRQRR